MAFRTSNAQHSMESDSRFDLTSALAGWTAEFAARGNLEAGKIAELESHLSDSIADLQGRGLDDAEAFLIATRRLGSPAQIEVEFEKAESTLLPRRALWWLVLGVAGWTTLAGALGTLEWGLALLGWSFTTNPTTFAVFFGMIKLLTLGLFVWALRSLVNHHPRIQTLVNFIAQLPWRSIFFVVLANGLFRAAIVVCSMVLARELPVTLAGNFARIMTYSSIISSVVSLGIIAFILGKVRPAQLAS